MVSIVPVNVLRDCLRGKYAVVPSINSGNVRFWIN